MDAPVWVTLVVALLVLVGTLFTAWQAREAAKASAQAAKTASTSAAEIAARASAFTVRSDRFADWQMHKRKVYGELLASVREGLDANSVVARRRMEDSFDAALLIAKTDLRNHLEVLWDSVLGPEPESGDRVLRQWPRLLSAMRVDIEPSRARTEPQHHSRGPDFEEYDEEQE